MQIYILPIYSPSIPNSIIIIPPINKITAIKDEYPVKIAGFNILRITVNIAKNKPITEQNKPQKLANRKGFSEKAVKPFIQSLINLKKEYPDSPTVRSRCSTSILHILLVVLSNNPAIYGI